MRRSALLLLLAALPSVVLAFRPRVTLSLSPADIVLTESAEATVRIYVSSPLRATPSISADFIPQEYLPLCAGLAVKAGMDPFEALKAITINPAKHIGIADRVGSIEVGKDADFAVYDGDPMVSDSVCRMVFIEGKKIEE